MKKIGSLCFLLTLLLSCSKSNVHQETDTNHQNGTDSQGENYCKAELFYDNGAIGFKVINAGGGIDLNAEISGNFNVTASVTHTTTIYTENGPEEFTQTENVTIKVSPWLYYKEVHSKSGCAEVLVTENNFIAEIHDKFKPIVGAPIIYMVSFKGDIAFYKTQSQIVKDRLQAILSGNIDDALYTKTPIDCNFEIGVGTDFPFMFSAEINGENVPSN